MMPTKAELTQYIEQLKVAGDILSEDLEGYVNDPVVIAYYKELASMTGPLWIKVTPLTVYSKQYLENWDNLVGELQREGLVDNWIGEENIDYVDNVVPDEDLQQVSKE